MSSSQTPKSLLLLAPEDGNAPSLEKLLTVQFDAFVRSQSLVVEDGNDLIWLQKGQQTLHFLFDAMRLSAHTLSPEKKQEPVADTNNFLHIVSLTGLLTVTRRLLEIYRADIASRDNSPEFLDRRNRTRDTLSNVLSIAVLPPLVQLNRNLNNAEAVDIVASELKRLSEVCAPYEVSGMEALSADIDRAKSKLKHSHEDRGNTATQFWTLTNIAFAYRQLEHLRALFEAPLKEVVTDYLSQTGFAFDSSAPELPAIPLLIA